MISRILILLTLPISLVSNVNGNNQYQNKYKKPIPSNGPCIDSIEKLEEVSKTENVKCLGCYENVQASCPSSQFQCQILIDNIYKHCNRINLPQRFFFDPPGNRINGYWNDEHIQRQMKVAANRCGCNSANISKPFPIVLSILLVCFVWVL